MGTLEPLWLVSLSFNEEIVRIGEVYDTVVFLFTAS